jgi:hypothetical protein
MIQRLMDLLKNHLSIRAPGPHRGLSTGAAAADRTADVASHRLKHHLSRHPVPEWVHQQRYLHPYPKELMFRKHV